MPKGIETKSDLKNSNVLKAADRLKPDKSRPIRALARSMEAASKVESHHHSWGQLVFSDAGVTKVSTPNSTHIVPPNHGLWIPPDMEHAATLLEHAKLFSVYIAKRDRRSEYELDSPEKWEECQAFKVSPLLHELIVKLSQISEEHIDDYEYWAVCTLIWSELKEAHPLSLGVVLPEEKRLKVLCNVFLEDPLPSISLKQLCKRCGISLSTASRLFQDQLGMGFSQWRQQVILANALALASQKMPINQIAYELGYASPSIFSAMVTRMVGMPPKLFFQY
ncbi:helix-turn-helix domain-containing protein [Marinomonas mediterranea]|jgi:AraC-type DNA-binding domain-containing proteins|uniref:Transcriptional regulator, AraC family n=1 Tax=Marinomonas mediterranea (strain ATCC 700492 / JCM 21426 / NBRC 103028 / MMB-1) TaxID=717774 RepID=F2JX59_MARM1|nr:helix-turn-helix transcriptional regulator [Marinomonas mediterranea]ADZ89578.1 transcriptional regulator, AraC family [Marinomonas mediterranea MMB-1]WCN11772.1 helix-turn-helix domain-containing protein [Marinomonas mediterranea]WCN15820.1 helix-turn-helix domain-containing protein [Marinomonas mediterranea MMB-1]